VNINKMRKVVRLPTSWAGMYVLMGIASAGPGLARSSEFWLLPLEDNKHKCGEQEEVHGSLRDRCVHLPSVVLGFRMKIRSTISRVTQWRPIENEL